MKRIHSILLVFVFMIVFSELRYATAQSLTIGTFPESYRKAEGNLYRKYVFNRRAKYRISTNYSTGASSKLDSPTEWLVIVGENASRANNLTDVSSSDNQSLTGDLQLQNESYSLQSGEKQGTYKIGAHRPRNGEGQYGYALSAGGPCLYPVTYASSIAQTTTGRVLSLLDSKQTTGPQFKLLAVRTTEWRSRPAVEAKFEQAFGIINLLYLDPANDLAFLGFESEGEYDPKSKAKSPVRITGWVTYRPSDEGFPLPTRFETWAIHPDGRRVPRSLSEVTEFQKYATTADDFDLEKQFGVKPLPLPGTAAATSGGRSWRWLYAGAAAMALVTLALAVVARRRRKVVAA